jgi:hypothetical protein
MFNLLKLAMVGMASIVSVAAAGCASKGGGVPAGAEATAGMMCPKCETVWVTRVVDQGTKVQRLASERDMTCPDCDQMAQSQLTADGKLMLHECATCKVTPQRLTKKSHPLLHRKGTY